MCPLDFSGNFCSTKKIPYREIFVNEKRKLVIHCKTFVKNSVAAFLVTKPRIHQQIPTIRSAGGQAVTALVSGMAVMALDPVERRFMRVHRDEQPFPEVRTYPADNSFSWRVPFLSINWSTAPYPPGPSGFPRAAPSV